MNSPLDFIKQKECWVVRADRGKSIDGFRNLGVVALDFDILGLPTEGVQVFSDKVKTYEVFQKFHPNSSAKFANWWGTFNMFCNYMKVGDVVISPTENPSQLIVGLVKSEIYFELGNETLNHTIRRKVEWLDGVFSKNEFPISLRSLFCNSTCFYVDKNKGEENEESEQKVSETIIESENEGVVYIMGSNTFPGTYKSGYADQDAELRCSALSSDKKYAIFNLEVLGYIKSKNYRRLEKAIHNHFAPVRVWSENGCNIDSELFKSNSFPEDFKEYVQLLQKQKYYHISEVVFNY